MYEQFFGLREPPFRLLPDPAYLFLSKGHEEALAHLAFAASRGEGFVEITGEVGTGKTTLCRAFLEGLDEKTEAAFIFNPKLTSLQLLKAVCDEFGIFSAADNTKDLIDALNAFLMARRAEGKNAILLIDEAQNLSIEVLEQLRLLSNLETTTSKLIQIILVGQPELVDLLNSPELRQLAQRITLSCRLRPLSARQATAYIRHRLHIAGGDSRGVFTPGALKTIHRYSRGVPRLINIVCDRALLTGFVRDQKEITARIARQAVGELSSRNRAGPRRPAIWKKAGRLFFLIAAALAILVFIDSITVFREGTSEPPSQVPAPGKSGVQQAPAQPPPTRLPPPPAPTPDIQPAAPETLTRVLADLDPSGSRRHATEAVLARWGTTRRNAVPHGEETDLDILRLMAAPHGLKILTVSGDMEELQRLNLPAVISFRVPEGPCCRYMALMAADGDQARLTTGSPDPENWIESDWREVTSRWAGQAYVAWRDVFAPVDIVAPASPRAVIGRLQTVLRKIGFSEVGATETYDKATRRAVTSIQRKHGLDDDGLVGPLTKIALLNEQTAFPVPRLNARQPALDGENGHQDKGGRTR